eukprot:1160074-Pelagomonas_calceolata.AAC.6
MACTLLCRRQKILLLLLCCFHASVCSLAPLQGPCGMWSARRSGEGSSSQGRSWCWRWQRRAWRA